MSVKAPDDPIVVGVITGAFGIKGWLKVKSYTQPQDNIVAYAPWRVVKPKSGRGPQPKTVTSAEGALVVCDDHSLRPQGLVVHIEGCDSRNDAELWVGGEIQVPVSQFSALTDAEYYWHQLMGLKVIAEFEGATSPLGRVTGILETGANDVLVVKASGADDGIDQRERLIPYVPEQYVISVDLDAGCIKVDWDPEF